MQSIPIGPTGAAMENPISRPSRNKFWRTVAPSVAWSVPSQPTQKAARGPDGTPTDTRAGGVGFSPHGAGPGSGLESHPMAKIFLSLFLVVFGLNLLFGLSVPIWVTGLLALIAGIMLAMECFGVSVSKK
jgi:hypothetical protein